MLPLLEGDNDYDFSLHGGPGSPACGWFYRLQPAAAGSTQIAFLEGEWEGSFLADVEDIRFNQPAESVGKAERAGPVLVTLKEFGRARDPLARENEVTYEFRLVLTVDHSAPADWKEGLKKVPLARRTLWQATCQKAPRFAGDTPEMQSVFLVLLKVQDPLAPEIQGRIALNAPPESITVRVGKSLRSGKFPFSFKDVRLPEGDR